MRELTIAEITQVAGGTSSCCDPCNPCGHCGLTVKVGVGICGIRLGAKVTL